VATTQRDYYEILGVGRTAGEQEIKSAFRKLARELHPDVSDSPDAEHRFKEVVEAYEVLSKEETRTLYDRYGHAGLRRGGFEPSFDLGSLSDLFSAFFGDDLFGTAAGRGGRRRGADIAAEVEIELAEAARGTTKDIGLALTVTCPACKGDGAEQGSEWISCPECHGSGRLEQVSRTVFGDLIRTQTCPHCRGLGRLPEHVCTSCGGSGRVVEERTFEVKIPPGIHDGQQIRVSGEGHAGLGGGRSGDIYVLVRITPDPRFSREGDDLFSTVDITMTEAAVGRTLSVPTIDGEVELELAAGTQPGEMVVLRGRGMPVLRGFGRGDHRVLVNVLVPRRLTDEQRALLEEFQRTSNEDTYRSGEGFFGKLKSAFR
jgi:molecular chaperone DnaJ